MDRDVSHVVELVRAWIHSLARFGAAFIVRPHAGVPVNECRGLTLDLRQLARVVAASHDFDQYSVQHLMIELAAFAGAETPKMLSVWSLTLFGDLALCVVADPSYPQSDVCAELESARTDLTRPAKSSSSPPGSPPSSSGQGAPAYAGFAAYLPRTRGPAN